jgi:heat shock protein HspQ
MDFVFTGGLGFAILTRRRYNAASKKKFKLMAKEKFARFNVGQTVHHRLFDYRGVVFDIDAVFSSDEEWYEQVAKSRPPKDEPWYHILPSGHEHTTYVAECNLELDNSRGAIEHPLLKSLFGEVTEQGYIARETRN